MVTLLVLFAVAPLVLRWYAKRVERSEGRTEDKVHRLRRAMLAVVFVWMPLVVVAPFELRAEGLLPDALEGAGVWVPLVYLAAVVTGFTLAYLAVHPVISRLRGLRAESRTAAARQARALAVMLLPVVVWLVLLRVGRTTLEEKPWVFYLLAVAWLLLVVLSAPFIVRLAMRTRPMPEQHRARLDALCRRQGVRVRDFRVLDTGPERMANAAVAGFFGRMRYVFVSDRLLEQFTPEELDAVVAHELGHAKQRHLPIKLGVHLLVVIVLGALWFGVLMLADPEGAGAVVLLIGFLLMLLVAIIGVHGALGLRLERKADDYAAAAADPGALRDGLAKLAELNMMKRRTGRIWNLLQQHPGLEERIERLDELVGEPSRAR